MTKEEEFEEVVVEEVEEFSPPKQKAKSTAAVESAPAITFKKISTSGRIGGKKKGICMSQNDIFIGSSYYFKKDLGSLLITIFKNPGHKHGRTTYAIINYKIFSGGNPNY